MACMVLDQSQFVTDAVIQISFDHSIYQTNMASPQLANDVDVDSWKTYALMLIYIRNPYAPEEAKLIESGTLTITRTVTNSEYSYSTF